MKHIKRIDEFVNYTDDAANNIPPELLNNGGDDDLVKDNGFSSELLSLKPILRKLVSTIIEMTADGKDDVVEEILNELSEEDRDSVISALNKFGEFLSNVSINFAKNVARQN